MDKMIEYQAPGHQVALQRSSTRNISSGVLGIMEEGSIDNDREFST
jgi:hypothetical protein